MRKTSLISITNKIPLFVFGMLTIVLLSRAFANPQEWKQVSIEDEIELQRALSDYESICVVKFDGLNQHVDAVLKGQDPTPRVIITEESYKGHKILDKKEGVLFCLFLSKKVSGDGFMTRNSKVVRIGWNEEPHRILVRSITGEKKKKEELLNPELYFTVQSLKDYLVKNHGK